MDQGMSEPQPTSVNSPPKTVMIVEDHPLNMRLAADLLSLNGFRVMEAADGETALRLLEAAFPDLILLDIHLPGLNGVEVFTRIRQHPAWRSLKVIAMTASVMKEEEQKIIAMGFDGFIAKPIDTRRFIQHVRSLLGAPCASA